MKRLLEEYYLLFVYVFFFFQLFQLGKIFYNYYTIEKESTELITKYVEEPKEDENDPLKRVINFERTSKYQFRCDRMVIYSRYKD